MTSLLLPRVNPPILKTRIASGYRYPFPQSPIPYQSASSALHIAHLSVVHYLILRHIFSFTVIHTVLIHLIVIVPTFT